MELPVLSMIWNQIRTLKPSFVSKKPHFNFITAHCKYSAVEDLAAPVP